MVGSDENEAGLMWWYRTLGAMGEIVRYCGI